MGPQSERYNVRGIDFPIISCQRAPQKPIAENTQPGLCFMQNFSGFSKIIVPSNIARPGHF